ncbi:hypothetical protein C3L33_23509, partial [Rhododendron williamsianum]
MDEPDTIALDPSFDDSSLQAKFILVGKILSTKSLNKKGVCNVIAKAWRTSEEVSVAPWGDNLYAFGFKSEDDVTKIMGLCPWSIMGCLMVLRKWDAQKTLEQLDFNFSPFWVQIQGLPLGFLNVRSGMKIAESLGDVIAVEDPDGKAEISWLDTIQFGDSKPAKLFYPANKEIDDRNIEADGGACNSQSGERVGNIQNQLACTEENGDKAMSEINADSGAEQVSQLGTSTRQEGLKDAAVDSEKDRQDIPSARDSTETLGLPLGPVIKLSSHPKPKDYGPQYFVEEPDSPKRVEEVVGLEMDPGDVVERRWGLPCGPAPMV